MHIEWTGSVVAVDGGGSGLRAALYAPHSDSPAVHAEGAAINAVTLGPAAAAARLTAVLQPLLARAAPAAGVVAMGCAGCANHSVRTALLAHLQPLVPRATWVLTDDIRPVLEANAPDYAAILVTSGTGSGAWRKDAEGTLQRWGGFGPALGDPGSAHALGLAGLRASLAQGLAKDTSLLQVHILRKTGCELDLNVPGYAARASASEIAALAPDIVALAEQGEPNAIALVRASATDLATLATQALKGMPPAAPIFIDGGLLIGSAYYRARFLEACGASAVTHEVRPVPLRAAAAVYAWLKQGAPGGEGVTLATPQADAVAKPELPPTEGRYTGPPLDSLSARGIVEAMSAEDERAVRAVREQAGAIAALMERIAASFEAGGRLIYLGAGTSGRLGVLDASECVPTFGIQPGRVLGLLAGGEEALRTSIEGAEDDANAAAEALAALDPPAGEADVVVGITASGTTPYVLGGLAAARTRGAITGLIHCNPGAAAAADHLVALATGPEVLPGSTRLKAGTATKLVLNTLTTGAMALSGRVYEGYMVGVNP